MELWRGRWGGVKADAAAVGEQTDAGVGHTAGGSAIGLALLALAAGSRAGEMFHVAGVRQILADVGLDEAALGNPREYSFDGKARNRWVRAGQRQARVTMNCSGKHAAMLARWIANAWSTDDYLDAGHPVQQSIHATVEEFAGEPVAGDGCGVAVRAISLTGLARAFGLFASAPSESLPGRIAGAFAQYPQYVSGSRRLSAKLSRATPGLFGTASFRCRSGCRCSSCSVFVSRSSGPIG